MFDEEEADDEDFYIIGLCNIGIEWNTMTNKSDVTIIIPAHNEEEGIADVINGIKQLNKEYEIIIVDDGSTDNTYKLASDTGIKVVRHPYNKGYGATLLNSIIIGIISITSHLKHYTSEEEE